MKPTCIFLVLFAVLCCLENTNGYRILGLFPLNMQTHFIMFQEVLKALVDRGHRVDVVGHYPMKRQHPNYTNIINMTAPSLEMTGNLSFDTFKYMASERAEHAAETYGNKICNLLATPELQTLIENPPNDPPYDLVITELFYANCYFAFGRHLKVPVVAITPGSVPLYANEPLGNPLNTAFVSEHNEGSIFYMNFWQRLKNTIFTMWTNYRVRRVTDSQSKIVKKYFGPEMPDVRELERDLSLILVNSHHTLTGIRPNTPSIVEIGGIHVQGDRSEISAELKKWLDNCTNGFLYVSFGSILTFEALPKETIARFYSAFSKIAPIRVLIRLTNVKAIPPGLPKNVLGAKFIPQVQVLKHPNIRGFITHGSLTEIQEAVSFRIPIIGIPIFADQPKNIKNCVDKGVAVSLDYTDITTDNLIAAVKAIVQDPKYKNNMIALSHQFLDRPRNARDTAIFWIEYILKHGADALRSPAVKLSWWQLALLDIYASMIITGLIILYLFKRLFAVLIRRLFYKSPTLPTSKKMV